MRCTMMRINSLSQYIAWFIVDHRDWDRGEDKGVRTHRRHWYLFECSGNDGFD